MVLMDHSTLFIMLAAACWFRRTPRCSVIFGGCGRLRWPWSVSCPWLFAA